MEWLKTFGPFGLFISAFLAATILPLSSELVLSALLLQGLSPLMLIAIATLGNTLGSLSNYALGYWAGVHVVKRYLKISDKDLALAEQRFKRYGLISLCFAWVPIIGDPLTVVAGLIRIHLGWFILLVALGKLSRYAVLSYLVLGAD